MLRAFLYIAIMAGTLTTSTLTSTSSEVGDIPSLNNDLFSNGECQSFGPDHALLLSQITVMLSIITFLVSVILGMMIGNLVSEPLSLKYKS